ncbi:cell envelope integrity protein TolA [Muribaculum intestinale]|uniref:Uncharacterized protein n=1 Tax=Muribaculum intestinale TaxID=1796646 RepID=A0A4S2FWW9_9BACT|nr:cell envelope integrity protein TolA [Muribaculum intestinale]MYM12795.1 hypothetical protein [Muribaculum intestinale]TGY73903.1 hypothetical protein E5333_08165 [Muribaculum intestinale]
MSNEVIQPTTTALAIASSAENVGAIVRNTPESFRKNQLSHDNCLRACENLLVQIKEKGMTDELDKTAATYLERTRRTVKAMTELRSPVTKLFDQVRKEFTTLENDIDPTKAGTVPYQLQQLRNMYAAKKREEEEAKRRAEEAKRQADMAREQYRNACEDDYRQKFNDLIVTRINKLTDLNSSVNLDNYKAVYDTVAGYAVELPADWCPPSSVRMPFNLTSDESRNIRGDVMRRLIGQFAEQYRSEIGDYRQEILDKLPSKKSELERAAKASEEEAKRIAEEIKKRDAAELARKEAERVAREQEEAKKKEVQKAGAEAASLFDLSQATAQTYQPKTKVTKKIRILNPNGYMQVLMMWWAKEGSRMTDEELAKIFKKQISFCEKVANKDGEFINDGSVVYVDDVKAQ